MELTTNIYLTFAKLEKVALNGLRKHLAKGFLEKIVGHTGDILDCHPFHPNLLGSRPILLGKGIWILTVGHEHLFDAILSSLTDRDQ